ncbi:MAG TPA: LecA/PA-IL family lectin [Thermoanaerobaculia bacterium]|nr:LecA/PA-IL family lectin [Thermoanaerobaculia bacterium]
MSQSSYRLNAKPLGTDHDGRHAIVSLDVPVVQVLDQEAVSLVDGSGRDAFERDVALNGEPEQSEPARTDVIEVSANTEEWVTSDLEVEEGDEVEIRAKGKAVTTLYGAESGPEGQSFVCDVEACIAIRKPYGALLARIATQPPIVVGRWRAVRAKHKGRFEFMINDQRGYYDDNDGAYDVTITITRAK